MLLDDRELARAHRQVAAATKAAELIGRELFRMFVNRSESGPPGAFDHLSDEALEQQIMAALMEGGISEQNARAFVRRRATTHTDAV